MIIPVLNLIFKPRSCQHVSVDPIDVSMSDSHAHEYARTHACARAHTPSAHTHTLVGDSLCAFYGSYIVIFEQGCDVDAHRRPNRATRHIHNGRVWQPRRRKRKRSKTWQQELPMRSTRPTRTGRTSQPRRRRHTCSSMCMPLRRTITTSVS